ncbi:hypothetical protein [Martelella mangrovi]|uniref:Uncharacterized protein n=1 Tax=Martelella mangrovi TaxID=1397477 RepID=A0ABV2I9N7_9HYPH
MTRRTGLVPPFKAFAANKQDQIQYFDTQDHSRARKPTRFTGPVARVNAGFVKKQRRVNALDAADSGRRRPMP